MSTFGSGQNESNGNYYLHITIFNEPLQEAF